jgi:outer membrane receptor protein involved in Fe transport
LELDYGLTDRLALTASIPFMSNRYVGSRPHDPRTLQNPHGEGFLDDGDYHSGWSDWGLGLRWLWRTDPVAITPFVSYYHPSHDYPIYTGTAFGTGQWRVDLGFNAGARVPGPIRNLYLQGGYAYSYMEKTEPDGLPSHRVNHSVLSLELGYLITPRLSASLGWRYRRTHDALSFPRDFNPPFTDDLYYYHDRLLPLEQSVLNLGVGYQLSDRYSLSVSYGRTLRVEFGHDIKRALGFGIVRRF